MLLIRVLLLLLWTLSSSYAEETDQFTLPPFDLPDSGPDISRRLYQVLGEVVAKTNADLRRLTAQAAHSRVAAAQLKQRRSGLYLANQLYQRGGPGFPRWMRWHYLPPTSVARDFKEKRPWKTVYWLVFSQAPLSVINLAPTVNVYGYYFGTDKLNHFFMQGHSYYKRYHDSLQHGKRAIDARKSIVAYGRLLEYTYLGTMMNGVYSNGDLAANYAGWTFYMNLTQPVAIGNRTLPPIVIWQGDHWQLSQRIRAEDLLRPYVSDHFNEALNPCHYTFSRGQIRRQIAKRCAEWVTRRGLTHAMVETRQQETRLWHGEDYGHRLPEHHAVTLNTCFGGQ